MPEDLIEADHLAMPEHDGGLGISGDLGTRRTGPLRRVAYSGPAPDDASTTGSGGIVSDGTGSFATYEEAQAAIEAAAHRFSEREVEPPEPLGEA